jgi:aldehyde dehydrogenase (NAD+)
VSEKSGFYIDGEWVSPAQWKPRNSINPVTEEVIAQIGMGSRADVDRAVAAARRAFPSYSQTSVEDRIALLERIVAVFESRTEDLLRQVATEIGAPSTASRKLQIGNAVANLKGYIDVLRTYKFEVRMGETMITREPIGVIGAITPWNWPMMPICTKVGAALAAGCTIVLKPSEFAPLSAIMLAGIFHDAGVPKGVFNMVQGEGPEVGQAIAEHEDIDALTFTGSVPAGIAVAKAAAPTLKRITQELGGKSAFVVLPDVDLPIGVAAGVQRCFMNAGQSCQAPSRVLVPRDKMRVAAEAAKAAAEKFVIGDPFDAATTLGPLANRPQFEKVQAMAEKGVQEGATLVTGGAGRPVGFNRGFFARPTVFADVTPDMTIAREEIFGPVVSLIAYDSIDHAIEIANGTPFGLAGYVHGKDPVQTRNVAKRLRAGRIYMQEHKADGPDDRAVPMGGYKKSGNGRERGVFGMESCLEVKAIMGYYAT